MFAIETECSDCEETAHVDKYLKYKAPPTLQSTLRLLQLIYTIGRIRHTLCTCRLVVFQHGRHLPLNCTEFLWCEGRRDASLKIRHFVFYLLFNLQSFSSKCLTGNVTIVGFFSIKKALVENLFI
eukprot:GHVP01012357.1.p1 GENE.GHVP01012357.1~~GHVP01012357.1.p1  ORF type:complete len:125 (-),score=5.20 GHVP01012357.1:32-406(-)